MALVINLDESDYAREFSLDENLIHNVEFEKALKWITDAIPKNKDESAEKFLHNTITVSGTRGSGKTSFLLSIRKHIKVSPENTILSKIQVLDLVDPTLIEEKGHVFITILSAISELVEDKFKNQEISPNKGKYQLKEWRDKLNKLADGLPSIDGIGTTNMDNWQDSEFIMENGIKAVSAARHLRRNFDDLLKTALGVLDKEAFLILFDDIDVDASKGWGVLESIRKYLTNAKVITLLSGDLKLYRTLVRQKKWKNFGHEILDYEGKELKRLSEFNDMVTELEAQYLLKIMQPKYRIHLGTLAEKQMRNKFLPIEVVSKTMGKTEISNAYKRIFEFYGIRNIVQLEVYITFMLNQPLRLQIQFLLLLNETINQNTDYSEEKIDNNNEVDNIITDIFLADLLEKRSTLR